MHIPSREPRYLHTFHDGMIRVSEHRRRVSAEKRNERNERPMTGVPAKRMTFAWGAWALVAKRR